MLLDREKKTSHKGLLHTGELHPAWGGTGTSIFDPVLCELVYRWFCPLNGSILDPFAGGSVRGIVAAMLDHSYFGIELNAEQLKANEMQWQEISQRKYAKDKPDPIWQEGDAMEVMRLTRERYDLLFSCPPYGGLEVYSDDPRDLSLIDNYDDFMDALATIINRCCKRLKEDRFACFVVGDYRNKKGFYNNFPGDTILAFLDAGLELYNECILVTAVGSLPIRAGGYMRSRKLGKTHQNVLVFYKGDPDKIKENFSEGEEDE